MMSIGYPANTQRVFPTVPTLLHGWSDTMDELGPITPQPLAVYVRRASEVFGVSVRDIISDRRPRDVVEARHAAIWAARYGTPYSLPRIGRFFRRDHTSIIHAVRKVDQRVKTDVAYRDACQTVLGEQ